MSAHTVTGYDSERSGVNRQRAYHPGNAGTIARILFMPAPPLWLSRPHPRLARGRVGAICTRNNPQVWGRTPPPTEVRCATAGVARVAGERHVVHGRFRKITRST